LNVKKIRPEPRRVSSPVGARVRCALAVALVLAAGWGGRPLAAQTTSPEAWREDLAFLSREMIRLHPNLFFSIPREQFDQAVAQLDARIPGLTDNQVIAELHKIAALPSQRGRDGHSGMVPLDRRLDSFLPFEVYRFSDGLFILRARSPHQDLVGAEVLRVGGQPVKKVYRTLDPLISRDNAWTVRAKLPQYLISAQLLEAVGIIPDAGEAELLVKRADGSVFPVIVPSVGARQLVNWVDESSPLPPGPQPLWLSDLQERFWFRFLSDSRTLYVRYNVVRGDTQSGDTMQQFANKLANVIANQAPERLVIDVRLNGGGDNTTYGPLLDMLEQNAAINQPGKLFTIMDRGTFSAAGSFVTDIERRTETLLVGEPTGGAPNQYGDARRQELPSSRLLFFVSTLYHQRSTADDPRLTHKPDLPAALSSRDFFNGRDPAMEAILAFKP